jgi:hypothetical protein
MNKKWFGLTEPFFVNVSKFIHIQKVPENKFCPNREVSPKVTKGVTPTTASGPPPRAGNYPPRRGAPLPHWAEFVFRSICSFNHKKTFVF